MKRFAILGVGGNVGTRHVEAICQLGHQVVAAADPAGSGTALERLFPDAWFHRESDHFWHHLRQLPSADRVDIVSICTPNFLHVPHVLTALAMGANAICEKPLVIHPEQIQALAAAESKHGKRVFGILQLRCHPGLIRLRQEIRERRPHGSRFEVDITYVQPRTPAYFLTWKGRDDLSGGLAVDMGIHFVDLLLWLFGPCNSSEVHARTQRKVAGTLSLERACVRFLLSTDESDLPADVAGKSLRAFRRMTVDGHDVDFADPGTNLHQAAYGDVLQGRGLGIPDIAPSLELAHRLQHGPTSTPLADDFSEISHPTTASVAQPPAQFTPERP